MSRIEKMPIEVPEKVEVSISGNDVKVKGPKESFPTVLIQSCKFKFEGKIITVLLKTAINLVGVCVRLELC